MAEIKFTIIEHIADLEEPNQYGWKLELNIVQWGDNKPKLDIRSWSEDHTKMNRGITLNQAQAENLYKALEGRYE